MKALSLALAFAATSTSAALPQNLFTAEQYPSIAETVIVLRYANARCPEYGIELTSDGKVFNGLVEQAQSRDPQLVKAIFQIGDSEMAKLSSLGLPAYCIYAQSKYPGMFKSSQ
ncbi:hypothetical protein HFN78_35075 [Rhizobium laguerreae]|uniref:hypothetical protein n=1 Tax=Rhizobium laguerreae TaxID=1076926 RepID=UPI001C91CA8B|nr:hypothetical protein [Rhizobium laguerreae]MBY3476056.1 hypothetical protein [Rhizobium laguerreae]MBY3521106.1 hypothetical protein [Rhizobium laguerreae]